MTQSSNDPEVEQTQKSPAPVLVLGAGQNLGLHIARRLVEENRPVLLSYRSDPEAVIDLQVKKPELVRGCFPLDARTPSSVLRFFERIYETTESLAGVVNTIGPFHRRSLMETSPETFEALFEGNLLQAFIAIQQSVPLLQRNRGGAIVQFTFAGVEKQSAYKTIGAYAACKSGLLSLIRSFSVELAPMGITVNAIAPGLTATVDDDQLGLRKHIPSGRLTRAEDVYQAVQFLLSEQASQITGTNLAVSGGFGWKTP